MILTAANLAAIGETTLAATAVASNGGFHGIIYLNVTNLTGLQAVAEHEIDEILGIGGWGSSLTLAGSYRGQASPTNGIGALDLFRFGGPGVRSFTLDPAATAYFSMDGGKTKLVSFNQYGNGSDFGDWGDGKTPADGQGSHPPQIQDAFGSGNATMGANELIALDVVGYSLASATPRIQYGTYAFNTFTFRWSAVPGQSYQAQFATNLTGNGWTNLGGPVTASNLLASLADTNAFARQRFYRVIAATNLVVKSLVSSQSRTTAMATAFTPVTNAPATHRFFLTPP